MTLDQLPGGESVFVDSNILVYHFQPHPVFGPMCQRLLERIEKQDIQGLTSATLLGELAHRLMVIEAGALPGWGGAKVLNRLKQQPVRGSTVGELSESRGHRGHRGHGAAIENSCAFGCWLPYLHSRDTQPTTWVADD